MSDAMSTVGREGSGMDRRRFLTGLGAGALGALGLRPLLGQEEKKRAKAGSAEGAETKGAETKGPYAPFKMSIQSYSLRKFDFEKTVEILHDLEIRYVELYPGHFPMELGQFDLSGRLRTLRHNSVRPVAYGVVPFTKDAEKNRGIFEFAKRLNLASISADPMPDSFESLDKLVEEFKIPVAIHNHGPEDQRYRTPEMIEKAIKDHHKLIGLCVDTGHFLRADVNPIEVVKRFKDRVYGVHVKDVKSEGAKKTFTVLGQGDLDTKALLTALKESGFRGGLSLEYEEEPDNPVASIKKCLEVVRETVKTLPQA